MSRLLAPSLQRARFTLFAPFYDAIVRLDGPRRRSIAALGLKPGERVVLIGAGTGADLPLLPAGVNALLTDITPGMLARARRRARPGDEVAVMDAHHLELTDGSFDAAILHLVLALVPDPARCLAEAARVVRPGGRLAVMDKFLPDNGQAGWLRSALNVGARLAATDINRRFADILAAARAPLDVVSDRPVAFGGLFRVITLRRREACDGG